MIDLYCERLGPGLWAEPLNAVTNLGYLVAAWVSWRLIQRSGQGSGALTFLVVVMALIGIGSGLFHTFATGWAQALDVAPILIFQLSFFWLYFRRVITWGHITSGFALVCLVAAVLILRKLFSAVLNGSLQYAPAFAVLLFLGVYHFRKQKRQRFALLAAAGLFMLALTFRTIDSAVCPYFPLGTHFAWHLLTASVLAVGMRGLVSNWNYGTGLTGHEERSI